MKITQTWIPFVLVAGGFGAVAGTVIGGRNTSRASEIVVERAPLMKTVSGTKSENLTALRGLNDSMAELATYVKPAVVHIFNKGQRNSDGVGKRAPMAKSEGSGFIYRKDGIIITNDHVVSGADTVTVVFADGREVDGKVSSAPDWDIAVVKVDVKDLPTLGLFDSKQLRLGEMVMAIGSPFGLENSVSFGHISGLGRESQVPDMSQKAGGRLYSDLVQTDAAINMGNSGGPLVNIDGQVIGMNSTIFSQSGGSNGIGFAIASNQIQLIAEILIEKGKVTRSMLGLVPTNLKPYEIAEKKIKGGARVTSISIGSPAEKAGLKENDIILSIEGKEMMGQSDVRNAMLVHAPGKEITVEYLRGTNRCEAKVKLKEYDPEAGMTEEQKKARKQMQQDPQGNIFEMPKNLDDLKNKFKFGPDGDESQDDFKDVQPLRSGKVKLGVGIDDVNDETKKKYGIPSGFEGVVITSVEKGSVAEKRGFKEGDVISKVGNRVITKREQLVEEIANINWGDTKKLRFSRFTNGSQTTVEQDVLFQ
jgi:S1-C subfamily serine protease